MRVCTVLRSGGGYRPEHVQRLAAQVEKHLPGAEFFALSDVPVEGVKTEKMEFGYTGWWSKIELAKPEITGLLLCFDLDTTVTGSLADMAARTELTLLADFYKPHKLQSGVMLLTEAARHAIWQRWMTLGPRNVQLQHTGDGQFLHSIFAGKAARWQDVLPGQLVSYKIHVQLDPTKGKHIGNGFVPPGARVVCWHGQPRPWHRPELEVAK